MNISWPEPGRYVVAASGGVDSTVLLYMLATHPNAAQWQLEVAHFNHGWSSESEAYEQAAREQAAQHNLPFHTERKAVARSEAAARSARYGFLRRVMKQTGATAIITAHHADDLMETVILNVQRGTGRRGLTPFTQSADVIRPLVRLRKSELIEYAKQHKLRWVEDPSNSDTQLRRNWVRREVMPKLDYTEIQKVVGEASQLNQRIDATLDAYISLDGQTASAEVSLLRQLSVEVLSELVVRMATTVQPGAELDRRTIEQLAIDLKTRRLFRPRSLTKQLSASVAHGTVTIVFSP